MHVVAKVERQTYCVKIQTKMTKFRCNCTRRQIPKNLSSSANTHEICHFHISFSRLILFPNFCYNVHLWMNYGYASFHNFWKPPSRVFGRVFTIAPIGWFAPNIFPFKGPYVKMWHKRYLHIMKILSSMYIYLK